MTRTCSACGRHAEGPVCPYCSQPTSENVGDERGRGNGSSNDTSGRLKTAITCAVLGGLIAIAGVSVLGYVEYHQALAQHAWTAAALTGSTAFCLAFPAAGIGSLVGYWIGVAVWKSQSKSSSGEKERSNGTTTDS
jgi:hypothetical protein